MTQKQMIKDYIEEHGSITPMEAFSLGITRLAARISELREDGIRVKTTTVHAKNRYGRQVAYAEYRIEGAEHVCSTSQS